MLIFEPIPEIECLFTNRISFMYINSFLKKYYKTILWSSAMFYMLFSPATALPKTTFLNIPHFDKIVHFTMFAILVFLLYLDTEKQSKIKRTLRIIFWVFTPIFSALSEVIQYFFIAGRSGNIFDFIADISGLAIGFFLYLLFLKYSFRNISKTE